MKSIVMPETVQLNEEQKKQLTAEVKETLAATTHFSQSKKMTADEMWKLQRNSRSASAMIRRWNLN